MAEADPASVFISRLTDRKWFGIHRRRLPPRRTACHPPRRWEETAMARLAGKVAIVTGAGTGIGRCTAELFAREGAKLVIAEIDSSSGEETAHRIARAGGEAIFLQTDV